MFTLPQDSIRLTDVCSGESIYAPRLINDQPQETTTVPGPHEGEIGILSKRKLTKRRRLWIGPPPLDAVVHPYVGKQMPRYLTLFENVAKKSSPCVHHVATSPFWLPFRWVAFHDALPASWLSVFRARRGRFRLLHLPLSSTA